MNQALPICLILLCTLLATAQNAPVDQPTWRADPAWHQGKAEWALYDATRVIYGKPRRYEATIFTNKQMMSPDTTTKSESGQDGFEVFKHNVSEIVPTDHYAYRFLTTSFVRTDDLSVYKVAASTQEDCGATYRQIINHQQHVATSEFCYFPGTGPRTTAFTQPSRFSVHNALTLTLRDYPFGAQFITAPTLNLMSDLTSTRPVDMTPATATITELGDETITVPKGTIRTHHLRVDHDIDGGSRTTDYWFAADPDMRHVLVKYQDDAGTVYQLKRLDWWAYWSDPRPTE